MVASCDPTDVSSVDTSLSTPDLNTTRTLPAPILYEVHALLFALAWIGWTGAHLLDYLEVQAGKFWMGPSIVALNQQRGRHATPMRKCEHGRRYFS